MSEIKRYIKTSLQQANLTEKDLERPGAHVVVADEEQNLHVLVKKTAANQAIDTLTAEVRGVPAARLVVEEQDLLDLGELGQWRDFLVEGLNDPKLAKAAAAQKELHIYSAAAKADDLGKAFHTSMDLAFAVFEVLGEGSLAVRPVPPGEREGRAYVEVTPTLRKVLHGMLGRWVDDAVPAETLQKAAERWRQTQNEVYESGLLGAYSLGLAPDRPAVPRPDVPAGEKAAPGQVGAELKGYLEGLGLEVPKKPSIAWAEEAIDALPAGAPDGLALELRALFVHLQEADALKVDDLFGEDLGPKAEKEIVNLGQLALERSRNVKLRQLEAGVAGLEVPAAQVQKLADQLALALEPRKKPSLILVAGPRRSGADRLMDLAVGMVGQNPLRVRREDIAEPGFPALYGQHRGFPTEADAMLSGPRLRQHRDTPAAHTPVVVEDVGTAGAAGQEREAAIRDLLERFVAMTRSGKVSAYSRDGKGRSEQREVPLANTVLMVRWEGEPAELERLLRGAPELQHLADKVVKTGTLSPEAGVKLLEQELAFALRQHYGPQGTTVRLSRELRGGLERAFEGLGAVAFDRFEEQLLAEIRDAVKELPAKSLEIAWSRMLTERDKGRLVAGEAIPFAARWFAVKEGK